VLFRAAERTILQRWENLPADLSNFVFWKFTSDLECFGKATSSCNLVTCIVSKKLVACFQKKKEASSLVK
jgi:hypothetical protein